MVRHAWACHRRLFVIGSRRLCAAWWVLGLPWVVGCTYMDARLVSPDAHRPVYELRGPDLAGLQQEAARLCPQGHEITRQWSSRRQVEGDNVATRWWNKLTDRLEDADNSAEMTVVCKALP